jgi:hypothetical protein
MLNSASPPTLSVASPSNRSIATRSSSAPTSRHDGARRTDTPFSTRPDGYVGVAPVAYLRDVLMRVDTHPASRIDELLPQNWQSPAQRLFG